MLVQIMVYNILPEVIGSVFQVPLSIISGKLGGLGMKDCLDNVFSPLYEKTKEYKNKNNNHTIKGTSVPDFIAPIVNSQNKHLINTAYNWVREIMRFVETGSEAYFLFIPTATRCDITPKGKGSVVRRFIESMNVWKMVNNCGSSSTGKSDEFVIYPRNAHKFYEFCKEHNLNQYINKDNNKTVLEDYIYDTLVNTYKDLPSEVEFGKFYRNKHGIDDELFKAYLITTFIKTHEDYNLFKELASIIPSKYYNQYEMKCKKKRGGFTLSFRMYNSFCSLPSIKNKYKHKELHTQYREQTHQGYTEYDVVSSISRMNYYKNSGDPTKLEFKYDFYKIVYDRYCSRLYNDTLVNTFTPAIRNRIKSYCNPTGFDKGEENPSWHPIRRIMESREQLVEDGYWVPSDSDLKGYRESLKILTEEFESVVGKFDNSIFYDESNIMLLIMKKLTDEGYDVIYCYDALYVNSPDIDFEKYYIEAIVDYYNMKWTNDYSYLENLITAETDTAATNTSIYKIIDTDYIYDTLVNTFDNIQAGGEISLRDYG